jgi:Domain of unknown function (DUF4157)
VVQFKLTVGRADDPAEREADAVAATVMERLRSGAGDDAGGSVDSPTASDTRIRRSETSTDVGDDLGGTRLDGDDEHDVRTAGGAGSPGGGEVLRRMEGAFGADFSNVRIRTGADVDIAATGLQARAFTVGRDVFIRRSDYRPGTAAGDELIAHELTHTLQQGGSRIRRSPLVDPVDVRHYIRGTHISTKKEKVHLDFIRMKRMDPQFSKIIGKMVGIDLGEEQSGGTYGHWWTEVGKLDPITNEFDFEESYGWWPKDGVGGLGATLGGVEGALNAGEDQDPHAGEIAPLEFHPVMEVDTAKESYDAVHKRVTQKLDTVAKSYSGKWHWRFGWGKNCHTFQQHLKTKTGIHYQKASKWLYDPAMQAVAQGRQQARQLDQERRDANLQMVTKWFRVKAATVGTTDPKTARESSLETGGKLGTTGRTMKDTMGFECVEIVTADGDVGWVLEIEWRSHTGQGSPG